VAERFVPLAVMWLLVCAFIGQSVHVAVPLLLDLWRDQTTAVEARVRLLSEMPLLPEPSVWELLRPASGRHRKRRLPRWLRIGVAS
jgi:hypothetical protein